MGQTNGKDRRRSPGTHDLTPGFRQMVGHTRSPANEVGSSPVLPCNLHCFLRSVGFAANKLLFPPDGQYLYVSRCEQRLTSYPSG